MTENIQPNFADVPPQVVVLDHDNAMLFTETDGTLDRIFLDMATVISDLQQQILIPVALSVELTGSEADALRLEGAQHIVNGMLAASLDSLAEAQARHDRYKNAHPVEDLEAMFAQPDAERD